MEAICASHRIVCLERTGTDLNDVIWENDILYKYRERIHVIKQWISNDISSTKIREALRRNLSIRYLTPDAVIHYINQHGLYKVCSHLCIMLCCVVIENVHALFYVATMDDDS
jgi:nicotinamide mononucleotide adenylyltransferase